MPFKTDHTWSPSTYRRAYTLWAANAPKTDGPIMPRTAQSTAPRNRKLSQRLRGLLTWRAVMQPEAPLTTSWMRHDLQADNFDGDEPVPTPLDCEIEIRPSISELMWMSGWRPRKGRNDPVVEWRDGPDGPVPVGGDVSHRLQRNVPVYVPSEVSGERPLRRDRNVVTRIGLLEFATGEQTEKCTVMKMGKPTDGEVRMPSGSLLRYNGRKPKDDFRAAKGSLPDVEQTVGVGGHNPGAVLHADPVVDREWAVTLRNLVGEADAAILDKAIVAANFQEVGELLGKVAKNAERYGKKAVVAACGRLDAILAANDNNPARRAA